MDYMQEHTQNNIKESLHQILSGAVVEHTVHTLLQNRVVLLDEALLPANTNKALLPTVTPKGETGLTRDYAKRLLKGEGSLVVVPEGAIVNPGAVRALSGVLKDITSIQAWELLHLKGNSPSSSGLYVMDRQGNYYRVKDVILDPDGQTGEILVRGIGRASRRGPIQIDPESHTGSFIPILSYHPRLMGEGLTHTIMVVPSLLESDAKNRQLLRSLTSSVTESNLVALLASLRRSEMGLSAIGNWSMGPHVAFLYMRADDKLMAHFSGNLRPSYVTNKRAIEILNYRPLTRGIHSRLTRKEVDALWAKNKADMPKRVLTIEPIPTKFL